VAKISTGLEICDSLVSNPPEFLRFVRELQHETEVLMSGSLLHAKVMKAMADAFYYIGHHDSSGIYLIQTIQIYEQSGQTDPLLIGTTYNDLGHYYQTVGKRNESRIFLEKAIGIFSRSSYTSSLADAISNLAMVDHSEGKFEEAIVLFKQVYEIDQANEDVNKQSNSLNSLGRMYIDWGKFETGIQYYKSSIELLDTLLDKQTLAVRYNNIGMAYQLMENHYEAISWIEKAKKIEELSGNTSRLATRYFNLANSYMALRNYEKAEELFMLANDIFSHSGGNSHLAKLNTSLGQLYYLQGKKEKALEHYVIAEQRAELNNALPEKSMIYNKLFIYFRETGQFDKALKYYEMYISVKDSMFSIGAAKQIEELEIQYETAQKELEIHVLETENELNRAEVRFRKRERNIASIGFIILLAMLAVLLKLYMTLRKQKSMLSNQNIELERLNTIQNQFFSIISHDFRNITSSYQASAQIIEHYLSKGQPEKLLPIVGEISKNSKNLSAMLENLLQWAITQRKGFDPEKKAIRVKEVLLQISELLEDQFKSKNNTIKIEAHNETVYCDPESFKLVIRNIVSNANKFTASGLIRIVAANSGNETTISISDTGIGICDDTIKNLFNQSRKNPRTGTSGEKGTGLGLLLVAEHLKKNSGKIEVLSGPDRGTIFIITLPTIKL
jgi:signal transduction histidine kinase